MFRLLRELFLGLFALTLVTFQGCAGYPKPAVTVSHPEQKQIQESLREAPLDDRDEATSIVLNYIASIIREKAGLKIAGIIRGPDLPGQVIAKPQKAEGLIIFQVLNIKVITPAENAVREANLSLALTIFDGSGESMYARTITAQEEGESDPATLLEMTAKSALKEYLRDPALRTIILKLRFGPLASLL